MTGSDGQNAGVGHALVGCGASKRSEACEAREMYTSTYFRKKREFAESLGGHWWILSAEHGAIRPRTEIEPYETHIDDVDADSWARRVYLALRADDCKWLGGDETLYVLAGQKYIDPIRGVLDDLAELGVSIEYPFAETSGIGEQLATLNEMTEGEQPDEAAESRQEGLDAFA